MSKFAWVTLSTNDTYSLGALVLAHSLKRVNTAHQLVVLVTPGVSESMRQKLKDVYNVVQEVNVLDSQDAANLALLARPELGITFTKLHCWRLVEFEKCVFLDADTLVLQNCDELFEREELSAAPDVSWPDCFNSGVFVYKPSLETFEKIIEFALKNGSFDGGDQGLLNSYFADWAFADIKKHLPFIYNVTAYASYCYLPAFKQFRDKIKILHFAGKLKPWLIQFNSENKTACTPSDYTHATDLIQTWWNIFCDHVHQNLTDSMIFLPAVIKEWCYYCQTRNKDCNHDHHHNQTHHHCHPNPLQQQQQQQQQYYVQAADSDDDFHDPWEDYYENLEKQKYQQQFHEDYYEQEESQQQEQQHHRDEPEQQEQQFINNIILHNSIDHNAIKSNDINISSSSNDSNSNSTSNNQFNDNESIQTTSITTNMPNEENDSDVMISSLISLPVTYSTAISTTDEATSTNAILAELEEFHANHSGDAHSSNDIVYTSMPEEATNNILSIRANDVNTNATTACADKIPQHSIKDDNNDDDEAGLAGALSHLRLGEHRTPEQEAYEQLIRRQCWESGQIDYAGKDSFDNIWKKITETLETKPETEPKQEDDKSEFVTSANIVDGKIEIDPKTKAKTQYKLIKGGYEVTITTPQPDGSERIEEKTYYDPTPCTDEEVKKEAFNKKKIQERMGKTIRIDAKTTLLTRPIEGGYEEVYTTVNPDGTTTERTEGFLYSVPENQPFPELLTSADIEDGKIEYDPVTKAKIQYKVLDGGYEVKTITPQPNGTNKTEVRTFWDPKPCSAEDLRRETISKKTIRSRFGKEIRIDSRTTMLTREIEGGYEEIYTTVNDDGTKSQRTKTFYDSVPSDQPLPGQISSPSKSQQDNRQQRALTKISSVDSTDSTESRRVVQKKNTQETVEQSRRVTSNIEYTENNRTVRKNSLQEHNTKSITHSGDTKNKSKKPKGRGNIPPPPPDFIENDTTTVSSKRLPGGGVQYTYNTQLESGKTITTSKTVYEEEEIEMTEDEIREYQKTLRDAEKHKNITTTKKLRSESGTKKVVPSENPGDVTTVETIKIKGGTEYHYTTVTAEGIVKKAVKTVYDPVPSAGGDSEEEEIIEEYEEEIIEPGEKSVRTFETVKKLPQKFEEEVTITHEKKEKKVKKSMMISH